MTAKHLPGIVILLLTSVGLTSAGCSCPKKEISVRLAIDYPAYELRHEQIQSEVEKRRLVDKTVKALKKRMRKELPLRFRWSL